MDFDINLRIRIPAGHFYWGCDPAERTAVVDELMRNALWDLDEVTVKQIEVDQVND